MDKISTTLSGNEDVETSTDNIDQQVTDTEPQVEPEGKTNEEEYAEAWDKIDIEQPPAELFGETTVQETSDEPVVEEETEQVAQSTNGLVITNPVLKFKGKEIPVDSEEEMIALAQKGFKLESEMSKIKPYKSMIKIIESAGLTAEDVQALADMKAGKKEALGYLKQSAGIEDEPVYSSEIFGDEKEPENKDYKPNVPVEDPVGSMFSRLTEEQPELAGKVSQIYDDIDDEFKIEVYKPNVFPMFVSSISSGEFDKLYPLAMKARMMNPALSWLEAYAMAGQSEKNPPKQEKAVPSNDTHIPNNKDTDRNIKTLNYDTAFDMSLDELEKRLFA